MQSNYRFKAEMRGFPTSHLRASSDAVEGNRGYREVSTFWGVLPPQQVQQQVAPVSYRIIPFQSWVVVIVMKLLGVVSEFFTLIDVPVSFCSLLRMLPCLPITLPAIDEWQVIVSDFLSVMFVGLL